MWMTPAIFRSRYLTKLAHRASCVMDCIMYRSYEQLSNDIMSKRLTTYCLNRSLPPCWAEREITIVR